MQLRQRRDLIFHPLAGTGFTLVELMIGLALSSLIMTALVTLVVNMSRAHTVLENSSRQIENGRYAMELLTEELKLAGYFADATRGGAVITNPDPCQTSTVNLGWSTAPLSLPASLEGRVGDGDVPACVAEHSPDTAMLILRRVSTVPLTPAEMEPGNPYLQTTQCESDPVGTAFVISQAAADFTLRIQDCAGVASVRRYISRIYYVSPCSDCGTDTVPTLKRLELRNGAMAEMPLAEGIEEVQYEYGFDVDGNGSPDQFATALNGVVGSALNDWSNVMTVRVWLISRTTEEQRGYTDTKTYQLGSFGARGPYNDRFKRRVYTALVKLNNAAGLRE